MNLLVLVPFENQPQIVEVNHRGLRLTEEVNFSLFFLTWLGGIVLDVMVDGCQHVQAAPLFEWFKKRLLYI